MPADVKEMLGVPSERETKRSSRSKSETRSVKANDNQNPKSPSKISRSKSKDNFVPPSLKERFDQEEKRSRINQFLNRNIESTSQTQSKVKKNPVFDALSEQIPAALPPPDIPPGSSKPKINLADVIIAAAAAKTVKLKSTGNKKLIKQ